MIVGVNADGLHEVFTTPFPEGEINGPEVHANMADALLANRSIAPSPTWVTVGTDPRRRRHRRHCRMVPQRVAHRRGGTWLPRRFWSGSRWSGSRAGSRSPSPFPRWRSSLPSSANSRGDTSSRAARSARSRSSSPATSRRTSSISSWRIRRSPPSAARAVT